MTRRILIVDDEPTNVEVLIEYIEDQDVTYDVATNGQEAVDLAAAHHYDVILMDLMMPVMDGMVATTRIRNMSKNQGIPPKIVALTAKDMSRKPITMLKTGFNEFVKKPFTEEGIALSLLTQINPKTAISGWTEH